MNTGRQMAKEFVNFVLPTRWEIDNADEQNHVNSKRIEIHNEKLPGGVV